jgi:hypothetical protein
VRLLPSVEAATCVKMQALDRLSVTERAEQQGEKGLNETLRSALNHTAGSSKNQVLCLTTVTGPPMTRRWPVAAASKLHADHDPPVSCARLNRISGRRSSVF